MHVQSCCFAHKTNCFMTLLLLLSWSSLLKVPNEGDHDDDGADDNDDDVVWQY